MELKLNSGRTVKFSRFFQAYVSLVQGDIFDMKLHISYIRKHSQYGREILKDLTFALSTNRPVEMCISVVDNKGSMITHIEYHRTILAAKSRANKLNKLYGNYITQRTYSSDY